MAQLPGVSFGNHMSFSYLKAAAEDVIQAARVTRVIAGGW